MTPRQGIPKYLRRLTALAERNFRLVPLVYAPRPCFVVHPNGPPTRAVQGSVRQSYVATVDRSDETTDRPIEACVILLPIFEFLHANERFHTILLEPLTTETEPPGPARISPLPYTLLTLASYLLTHASSVHAPRAIGYAHLSLNMLLVMAESRVVMQVFCNIGDADVRLCRQVSSSSTSSRRQLRRVIRGNHCFHIQGPGSLFVPYWTAACCGYDTTCTNV